MTSSEVLQRQQNGVWEWEQCPNFPPCKLIKPSEEAVTFWALWKLQALVCCLLFLFEVLCVRCLLSLTICLLQKYHSESKGTDQVAETQAQVDELKGIMVRNIGTQLLLVPPLQGELLRAELVVGCPLLTE